MRYTRDLREKLRDAAKSGLERYKHLGSGHPVHEELGDMRRLLDAIVAMTTSIDELEDDRARKAHRIEGLEVQCRDLGEIADRYLADRNRAEGRVTELIGILDRITSPRPVEQYIAPGPGDPPCSICGVVKSEHGEVAHDFSFDPMGGLEG